MHSATGACLGVVARVGLAACLTVTACANEDGDSCPIPTEEISAIAVVIDSGWDLRAAIDFEQGDRHGPGTPLRLCDADILEINGEPAQRIDKATRVEYSLTLPADGSRSFRFELVRADGDPVVLAIDLPAAFTLDNPASGDVLMTAEDQIIAWSPAEPEGTINVELGEALGEGTCIASADDAPEYKRPGGVQVPDTGQWTIPAGDLVGMSPQACPISYTLVRVERGDYPAALASGGRVDARVERHVEVQVDPQ
ncbi:MAG: hypothetical protein K0V04_37945 [Deltaproteobacteria bacterium]|nr:hypothetical protein [Deltaproteobacteria bacterium]